MPISKKKYKNLEQIPLLGMEYPLKTPLEEWPEGYTTNFVGYMEAHYDDKVWGLDTETNGLEIDNPNLQLLFVSVSAAIKTGSGFAMPAGGDELSYLRDLLTDPEVMVSGHNIKFDLKVIEKKLGIKIKCQCFDTMIASYFLDEQHKFLALEKLTSMYEDLREYKQDVNRKALEYENPLDALLYNIKDADAARRLVNYFVKHLNGQSLMPMMVVASQVLPIIARMELIGLNVDKTYANNAKLSLAEEMLQLRYEMRDQVKNPGFTPSSPQSVANVLYNQLGYQPYKFTAKIAPSTDYESIINLREQKHTPFLDTLLKYKKLQKLKTSYYDPLEEMIKYDGRIHAEYAQTGTVTGRFSSRIQTMPRGKQFRGMVIPSPGYIFLDGDFAQIEIRIAAWLAQEDELLQMFEDDLDVHSAVMADLFGYDYQWLVGVLADKDHPEYQRLKNQRVGIKNFNFALLYGAYEKKLQAVLQKEGLFWSEEQCKELKLKWENRYRNIVQWRTRTEDLILRYKQIRMCFGQLRRAPNVNLYTPEGRHDLRALVNFSVQSPDAWITICGMILLQQYFDKRPDLDGRILLQVHDNIMSEVRYNDKAGIYQATMEIRQVADDIKAMMESDIKEYVREVFKVNLNVKLKFDVNIQERWS